MPKLYNLARMTSATAGTGTLTLGTAVSGYLTFANAGVQNGDLVFYGIKDGANSEVGYGTYTSSGTTLSRNVIKSTNSNALISCSGSEEIYITALASDGGDLLPGFDHPMHGFNSLLNLQINATVASNILTVAVKTNTGVDPSNSNPILIPFRDPTIGNGGPIWRAATAANSIATVVGAHFGISVANTPFRLWVCMFDNAGGLGLALFQSVSGGATPTGITTINEAAPASTTAMSASATSAGVFYTAAGVTLTSKSFRVLGYLEFSSGMATPGSYASAPTAIQLYSPGIALPGEYTGNMKWASTSTNNVVATANTWQSTGMSVTMALASAMNAVEFVFQCGGLLQAAGGSDWYAMFRGATQIGPVPSVGCNLANSAGPRTTATCGPALDFPGTTSPTYTVQGTSNSTSSYIIYNESSGGVTRSSSAIWKEVMV